MKKLTAKQEWALEQIKQLQYSENLSAAAVCKKIGISDSSYSAIKSGTYNGDVDKQMKKVIEYFETKQAAAEIYVAQTIRKRQYRLTCTRSYVTVSFRAVLP